MGCPEEGERHTAHAVRKAPGSGMVHMYHGVTCAMLGRLEPALLHFGMAERLMPGSHLMWVLKVWQSRTLGQFGRWADAGATVDEGISFDPTYAQGHVLKALITARLGRDSEARTHIRTARQPGSALTRVEHLFRLVYRASPTLVADIATVRAL